MSHTPGLWRATTNLGNVTVRDGDGHLICRVEQQFWKDRDTCEANASLIAAAPDLLEYLKRVQTFLETIKPENVPLYVNSESLYNEIDELITKAEAMR